MNTAKLELFIQKQKESYLKFKSWNKSDDPKNLSPIKYAGWKRVLSSIATTEAIEEIMMNELKIPFLNNPTCLDYMLGHQQDEQKHAKQIAEYTQNTFNYKKTKRTLSDKILYDRIFPKLFKYFSNKPIYGLAMLLFFEIYALTFYKKVKNQAELDGLSALSELIGLIMQDEQRHLAGASILFEEQKKQIKRTLLNKFLLRFFLALAVLDLNMNRWAFYNRQVRLHMLKIGLKPSELTRLAQNTAQKIYNRFITSTKIKSVDYKT